MEEERERRQGEANNDTSRASIVVESALFVEEMISKAVDQAENAKVRERVRVQAEEMKGKDAEIEKL